MLTFTQVDWLVTQWAAWRYTGDSTFGKLSGSKAKWQDQYRTGIDPEEPSRAAGVYFEIDDERASMVDRVMAAMLNEIPNLHFRTWQGRAVHGTDYPEGQVQAAYGRFVFFYDKLLSKTEQMRLNRFHGIGHRHA